MFALALVVYLFTAGGSLTTTDAVATFDVTRSIVEHGSVAMSGNVLGKEAERGRDGRYYSPFGIGQSIYNIPFYLAARAAAAMTGLRLGKPDSLPKAFVALGATVVSAGVVLELFLFAMALVNEPRVSAMASLTLAFASVLWPYSKFGFNQPLACFTLLAATRQAFMATRKHEHRRAVYAGVWLAASLLTRHEMAMAAVPIAAWLWWDRPADSSERGRRLAFFGASFGAGVVAWLVYNFVRFGNAIDTGYLRDSTPGFGSPILAGCVALLASPSASVFLYSPLALAGVLGLVRLARTRDRSTAVLLASLIVVFLLFYATLGNWLAGRSYGSRYLLVVLPYFALGFAVLLCGLPVRSRRAVVLVVAAAGFVIQLPGVLIDYAKVSQSVSAVRAPFTTEQRQWSWEASGLVMNTDALRRAVPENLAYVLGRKPPPAVSPGADEADRFFSQQFSFSLDLWWLYLFYMGKLSRVAVAGIAVLFLAGAAVAGLRLRAALGRSSGLY